MDPAGGWGGGVPRRHPRAFWTAMLLAVGLFLGGLTAAALGHTRTAGPEDTVRGYFDALSRGDAPTALAYGRLPAGSRDLLTSTVLREQQRIAPISSVSILSMTQTGLRASARVRYTMRFGLVGQPVTDRVDLVEADGRWQLTRTAVATQLSVTQGAERATVAGGAEPVGSVLVFPGAAPVRFDTPYLQLRPADSVVGFGSGPTTQIFPQVSSAGRSAAVAAVARALRNCFSATVRAPDLRCPQPDGRVVPGSLRGTVVGTLGDQLSVGVGFGAAGLLDVSGTVRVSGRYRKLDFDNRVQSRSGALRVSVHAIAYAVAPVVVSWQEQT